MTNSDSPRFLSLQHQLSTKNKVDLGSAIAKAFMAVPIPPSTSDADSDSDSDEDDDDDDDDDNDNNTFAQSVQL